jgi:hypothetical protein
VCQSTTQDFCCKKVVGGNQAISGRVFPIIGTRFCQNPSLIIDCPLGSSCIPKGTGAQNCK